MFHNKYSKRSNTKENKTITNARYTSIQHARKELLKVINSEISSDSTVGDLGRDRDVKCETYVVQYHPYDGSGVKMARYNGTNIISVEDVSTWSPKCEVLLADWKRGDCSTAQYHRAEHHYMNQGYRCRSYSQLSENTSTVVDVLEVSYKNSTIFENVFLRDKNASAFLTTCYTNDISHSPRMYALSFDRGIMKSCGFESDGVGLCYTTNADLGCGGTLERVMSSSAEEVIDQDTPRAPVFPGSKQVDVFNKLLPVVQECTREGVTVGPVYNNHGAQLTGLCHVHGNSFGLVVSLCMDKTVNNVCGDACTTVKAVEKSNISGDECTTFKAVEKLNILDIPITESILDTSHVDNTNHIIIRSSAAERINVNNRIIKPTAFKKSLEEVMHEQRVNSFKNKTMHS